MVRPAHTATRRRRPAPRPVDRPAGWAIAVLVTVAMLLHAGASHAEPTAVRPEAQPPEAAEVAASGDGALDAPPAQDDAPATGGLVDGASVQVDSKTTVQVGVYILRIPEFSERDERFTVDAWFWFRWQGADVRPHETFEIVNGTIHERTTNDVLDDLGFNYATVRVQATVYHAFDVRNFPFDDHVVTLELEDSNLEAENLEFVADEGIALDPAVAVSGFRVQLVPPHVEAHRYDTVYGYRSLGTTSSTYSRFIVPISLTRSGIMPVFKLFWVSFLSVVLGLLAFRVRSSDLDARFGLGTGSIFAASANHFVVNEQLPQTTDVTLAEQVNLLAVGTIFLAVFLSVASLRLRYRGLDARSESLDRIALVALGSGYLIANTVVLTLALTP